MACENRAVEESLSEKGNEFRFRSTLYPKIQQTYERIYPVIRFFYSSILFLFLSFPLSLDIGRTRKVFNRDPNGSNIRTFMAPAIVIVSISFLKMYNSLKIFHFPLLFN